MFLNYFFLNNILGRVMLSSFANPLRKFDIPGSLRDDATTYLH